VWGCGVYARRGRWGRGLECFGSGRHAHSCGVGGSRSAGRPSGGSRTTDVMAKTVSPSSDRTIRAWLAVEATATDCAQRERERAERQGGVELERSCIMEGGRDGA
jgi:hypothetical protein